MISLSRACSSRSSLRIDSFSRAAAVDDVTLLGARLLTGPRLRTMLSAAMRFRSSPAVVGLERTDEGYGLAAAHLTVDASLLSTLESLGEAILSPECMFKEENDGIFKEESDRLPGGCGGLFSGSND